MLERLEQLEENIGYLKKMKATYSIEEIKANKFDEWSLRYGVFESIQIVIDIACHLSNRYNLGIAKTYTACIENLSTSNYISHALSKNIISAIGLRNLLIYEYVQIDIEQLYSFLDYSDDFSTFIKEVKGYL